jgi:tRNA-2-methylthio-N6-dimethylallyladenosine synthase
MNPIDPRYLLTARNDDLAQTARPRFFVRNYGCQMNERDAEKLRALLTQLGYEPANQMEDADLILFNTCCVRESAEDKIYGHLSRIKTMKAAKPDLFVIVCGCMAQRPQAAEIFRTKHKYINVVCGTANRHRLPEFIWLAIQSGKPVIDISEGDGIPELIDIPVTTREFRHKAGVNIMYGCDNFCSFCIVPHVRGREKSRPAQDILTEVRVLAEDGVSEIMLLGQNVNAYNDGMVFADLLRHVHDGHPTLKRIRFMTSHPKDFSDTLITAIRDLPRVCKAVHLPLQSGSTRILADMNRKYTKEQYINLCEKLQTAIPCIAITTDIIVGYPGETDSDFEDTLDVVRRIRFAGAFTFIYSKRSGTPAADRTDTVPRKTVNERFEQLTALLYPIMEERNRTHIGQTTNVMVEEAPTEETNTGKGRMDDNTLVHFNIKNTAEAAALQPGDVVPVCINEARSFYVSGSVNN